MAAVTAEGCAASNVQAHVRSGESTQDDQRSALESRSEYVYREWPSATVAGLEQIIQRLDPQQARLREALTELDESILRLRASGGARYWDERERLAETSTNDLREGLRRYDRASDQVSGLSPHQASALLKAMSLEADSGALSLAETHRLLVRLQPGIESRPSGSQERDREEVPIAHLSSAETNLLVVALNHSFARRPGVPADFLRKLVEESRMEYRMARRLYLGLCSGANLGDDMTSNDNWEFAFNQVDPQGLITPEVRERTINQINLAFARSIMQFVEGQRP